MPLVIQEYPNSSASRACSNISRKRTCMSSPCGNCARIIKPNCISAMACSLLLVLTSHDTMHPANLAGALCTALGSTRLAGQLAVRSSRALLDVCANALNGLLPLGEYSGKEVPDVDHL